MTKLTFPLALSLLVLSLSSAGVSAKDLGVIGDTFPIAESDFIDFIKRRLGELEANGTIAREQEKFKQRVIENTLRPPPVAGLGRAKEYTSRLFDPSFVVAEDQRGPDGQLFARKGVRINPLSIAPFNQTLYFIDGDDEEQLKWFKGQRAATLESKVILVSGNVKDTSDALASRVYFDQGGVMVQRFGITALPARVTAATDRTRLLVEQFDAGEAP